MQLSHTFVWRLTVCLMGLLSPLLFASSDPNLSVSSNSFSFVVLEAGTNPADQPLTISNPGGGTLDWSLDLTDQPAWLSVLPTSGSLYPNESETVTLSVNSTVLSDGLYSYAFDVFDPAAQNSPQTLTVYLKVGSALFVPGNFPTIQMAIDASIDGDTVFVSPGTYYENINFNGRNIVLTSTDPEDSNVVASTIIDGGGNGSVVTFSGTETSFCLLQGFTVKGGVPVTALRYGGGVCGNHTHATISCCTITDNLVDAYYTSYGGGLSQCDGLISNCSITHNQAMSGGGLYDCDGLIVDCDISNNLAQTYYFDDDFIVWLGYGGGLASCDGTIANCNIHHNRAKWGTIIISPYDQAYCYGGGLYQCDGSITNCTIMGNVSGEWGGGLYYCMGTVTNSIIWGNSARDGNQLYYGSTPTYSCIQNWAGGGIASDPLFADAANDDYHLKSEYGRWDSNTQQWMYDDVTSPCIDAGKPDPDDWHNELWPHGGRINMGAYGGTPQASMSGSPVGNVADLDHDDAVGISDLLLFSEDWLMAKYLRDTDLNRDGLLDIADFAEFANQWLWTEPEFQ
jgi:hypothetical protein